MNSNKQTHGSIPFRALRKLGIAASEVIDFSATVNPYPLPVLLNNLISADGISHYPDNDCYNAVVSLAKWHSIPTEWIAITAGITEVVFILPRLYKNAIQFSPTYGDFSKAYQLNRKSIHSVDFPSSESELNITIDLLKSKQIQLLIICNPNNPDGKYLPVKFLKKLCMTFRNAVICIDESYQELGINCESSLSILSECSNLIVLKSLTKPFGIGGLRGGYVISSGKELERIRKFLLPWGVSSPVQSIIPLIINKMSIFEGHWKLIHQGKQLLVKELESIGIKIDKSVCPFFLAQCNNAVNLRHHLLKEYRIAVRDCTSFGLPDTIRIMPSKEKNNEVLFEALKQCKDLWNR